MKSTGYLIGATMQPENAQTAFERYLAAQRLSVGSLTPKTGISAALSFYRDERAEGCEFDTDRDMLLFQWGTYDWGAGRFFDLDITRQLILAESAEDDEIWQLSLTFKFVPTDTLHALRSGNRWCHDQDELKGFAEFIQQSAAYQTVADRAPDGVELEYFCAG